MLVLLDESGDAGAKGNGAKGWLCIAVVTMPKENEAALSSAFATLRRDVGGNEFHFKDDADWRRKRILGVASSLDFEYRAVACDKSLLKSPTLLTKPKMLYRELATQLFNTTPLGACEHQLDVRFDTLGGDDTDVDYANHLRERIRRQVPRDTRINIRPRDSDRCDGIQLVDYVCGAVARSFRDQSSKGNLFRNMIRCRERDVIEWPRK